ncbi:radical SAM protein [Sorangium sp. So ce887]|uniref:radical SAM protein n=1 Tax=Sorangium sp. So ce887 TaxID=3133324 RepID=UPI003F5E8FD0
MKTSTDGNNSLVQLKRKGSQASVPQEPVEIEPPEVLLERALALAVPAARPAAAPPLHAQGRAITRRGVLWLGQTCNLRCHFCYFLDRIEDKEHPEHPFMSLEKAQAICRTLVDFYGNTAIDIQGGEPTIWRDIHALVRYCVGIGLSPTLITNALVLDKRDKVQQFKDSGVADFLVSVQGLGKAHDLAVGADGAHVRQMRALNHLIALGVPFRVNCVMSKRAVPQLPAVAKLAVEVGARAVNFLAFNPFADQRNAGVRTAENVPRYAELREPLDEALDVLARAGVEANVRYLPHCVVSERHWPSVYDYQQLPYDPHEWDFASWTWTNKGPQRMRGGLLTPPVPLGARPRLGPLRQPLLRLADALDLRGRLLRADVSSRLGPSLRKLEGLSYRLFRRRGDQDAAYRGDALNRVEHNGYEKGAGCRSCALRDICDGFHGDYVAMFGSDEARPVLDRGPVTDPRAFISTQAKVAPAGGAA